MALSLTTLKSLIEEHARLDFSDYLSTLFAIFHVINEKFHPGDQIVWIKFSVSNYLDQIARNHTLSQNTQIILQGVKP
jgi:hypothetical protein